MLFLERKTLKNFYTRFYNFFLNIFVIETILSPKSWSIGFPGVFSSIYSEGTNSNSFTKILLGPSRQHDTSILVKSLGNLTPSTITSGNFLRTFLENVLYLFKLFSLKFLSLSFGSINYSGSCYDSIHIFVSYKVHSIFWIFLVKTFNVFLKYDTRIFFKCISKIFFN